MITVLQILMVLLLIVILIVAAFRPRKKQLHQLPSHYKDLLWDYVKFYRLLSEDEKKHFEFRVEQFLAAVKITGVNAEVEDLDRVLIAAGAVIPVFYIYDWQYVNLREVLVYPGNFNMDFDQHGRERNITGMVGTGAMQYAMIISKWELRQGFINQQNAHNTAIHEFVHLIDKMDGTFDGVPEILLEKQRVAGWKQLLQEEIHRINAAQSDIDPYAATNMVECFAVVAEYFFEQPERFAMQHPALNSLMKHIFIRESFARGAGIKNIRSN